MFNKARIEKNKVIKKLNTNYPTLVKKWENTD
jgi:hypothetical protein